MNAQQLRNSILQEANVWLYVYSILNLNVYGVFPPIFPPLAEQHRIVERIEELMGKIEMI